MKNGELDLDSEGTNDEELMSNNKGKCYMASELAL